MFIYLLAYLINFDICNIAKSRVQNIHATAVRLLINVKHDGPQNFQMAGFGDFAEYYNEMKIIIFSSDNLCGRCRWIGIVRTCFAFNLFINNTRGGSLLAAELLYRNHSPRLRPIN